MKSSPKKDLSNSLFLICIALTSCTNKSSIITIKHERGNCIIDNSVDNLLNSHIPQDISYFYNQIDESKCKALSLQDTKYNERFFSPWRLQDSVCVVYAGISGFGENLHRWNASEIEIVENNAKNCTKVGKQGIITKNTMAHVWPTEKPVFRDVTVPGASYPFDDNIQSMMKIGLPVYINYLSKDAAWLYVTSHLFSGWINADDVAIVDNKFMKTYQSSQLVVAVRDGIAIKNNGVFFSTANIGTVLPSRGDVVLAPFRNSRGKAEFLRCKNLYGFVKKPLRPIRGNIIAVAQEMLGKNYGWGGFLNNRDCSMLTSDFFAVFGKHIEKHSYHQLEGGKNVKNLNYDQKNELILKEGTPFLTLAGWNGHVMIYVGTYNNKPIFLHNLWAIVGGIAKNSRYVVGKTILTPLNFGNDGQFPKKVALLKSLSPKATDLHEQHNVPIPVDQKAGSAKIHTNQFADTS